MGGETLIICSSTRSAIVIEYFSVQYNRYRTPDRNVKFSGITARYASPVNSVL
jgi:hypothetical protein